MWERELRRKCRRAAAPAMPTAVLLLATFACSEATTSPRTGQLRVFIEGLPAGTAPVVVVTGPDAFRQQLDSGRTLTALTEGTYTISAAPVTTTSFRYAATPASQTVNVTSGSLASASLVSYRVASVQLTVTVIGLPSGAPASVTLTGPSGFSRSITTTTQIGLLEPGTYTLAAASVQTIGKTYRAVQASRVLQLSEFVPLVATTVEYGPGTGSLGVTINGLPAATDAAVSISGPGGFSRQLTESATLGNLEAGRYTITAAVVGSALATHAPAPATQTVDIIDGAVSAATVAYASSSLSLGLRLFMDGLAQPVFLTAPDGDTRQFIVERGGRVRIVANGVLLPTPFLDIRSRVNNTGERGMLSMAFDPQYATTGYLYVYYTDLNSNLVVERINSTPGSNVAGGSGGVVLTIPHGGIDHHGGLIAFGPDGMLYLGPGDGGCCGDPNNNAQNTNTLLGKILRVDVRTLPYTIPAGNPFVGDIGGRAEIWAYGLRNPWRFAFDAPTNMLYIGDVGNDAREEVDAVPATDAGLNFGWRLMEGTACFSPSTNCAAGRTLVSPVLDYPHSDGCSVIGGYVYRGSMLPELTGYYLYADYCAGWLRTMKMSGRTATEVRTWAGISLPQANSFGRDGAGELYMISGSKVWAIVRQ
ncbi:MAG: glucose dehydrogenase [Gemmatimonadetes bacterium]|nr:glucose dehydrogenase [Gemmatimonadota bacterium]